MPDRQDLVRLEAVVARGVASFVEMGCALLEIRSRELYKLTHPTWRVYCRERWGWDDSHARRLILAAEVAENLQQRPIISVPTGTEDDAAYPEPQSERQVRPLAGLPPEAQRTVWGEAHANGHTPTAKEIAELVAKSGVPIPEPEEEEPPRPSTPRECLREEVETQEEDSRERGWLEDQLRRIASGEKKIRQALQWFERVDNAEKVRVHLGRAVARSAEARSFLKALGQAQGWLEKAEAASQEL